MQVNYKNAKNYIPVWQRGHYRELYSDLLFAAKEFQEAVEHLTEEFGVDTIEAEVVSYIMKRASVKPWKEPTHYETQCFLDMVKTPDEDERKSAYLQDRENE